VVLALVRARVGPPGVRGWLAVAVTAGVLAAGFAISFTAERTEEISKSAERVTTFKTYRGDYWRVALGSFADHPVAGVGTRGFQVEFLREHDTRVFADDAHSLYIETLAELGLVGFLLLAALIAAVAGGLRRAYRAAPGDPLVVAAAAVLAAFAVHAGMDWDWEVPAVTLPALLLAAAVVQRPGPGSP
jgi:O-antigen ligase